MRKVGNRGRTQKSLRSVKMRSQIATGTPGSSVQGCEHQGERRYVCVCVCEKDMLDVVYTVYAIYTVDK